MVHRWQGHSPLLMRRRGMGLQAALRTRTRGSSGNGLVAMLRVLIGRLDRISTVLEAGKIGLSMMSRVRETEKCD